MQIRNPIIALFLMSSVFFASNCSNGLHLSSHGFSKDVDIVEFKKLDTGMTMAAIKTTLSREPVNRFPVMLEKDTFYVIKYIANLGSAANIQSNSRTLDIMYLLTKNDSLLFWGLSQKYKMQKDTTKVALINIITEIDSADYKTYHNDVTIFHPYQFKP